MTEEDFKECGFTLFGERRKLMIALKSDRFGQSPLTLVSGSSSSAAITDTSSATVPNEDVSSPKFLKFRGNDPKVHVSDLQETILIKAHKVVRDFTIIDHPILLQIDWSKEGVTEFHICCAECQQITAK